MDWAIKSLARVSFVSGQPFAAGDRVTCVIFRGPEGLQRADLGEAEAAGWTAPGPVLGRWVRKVETEDEAAKRRQALASAEEVFLAFMENPAPADEDRELLVQLLAVMLERKRILRPMERAAGGRQRYWHSRLQKEFSVLQHPITPERLATLSEQLHHLAS